jgi:hypothetical protein
MGYIAPADSPRQRKAVVTGRIPKVFRDGIPRNSKKEDKVDLKIAG